LRLPVVARLTIPHAEERQYPAGFQPQSRSILAAHDGRVIED
jgi:hypothetical protein